MVSTSEAFNEGWESLDTLLKTGDAKERKNL